MRIVVFDTETTGLPKTKVISPDTLDQWPYIVQFSYLIFDTSLNTIVKHGDDVIRLPNHVSIPQEATNIHHITNEMSRSLGAPLAKVLNEFFYYARSADKLVGHNVEFDINIVKVELMRMICEDVSNREWIQTCKQDLHFITNFNDIQCTMTDSTELCNIQAVNRFGKTYTKFPKLAELYQTLFGCVPNNLHNSFHDILVTLRCYMKLHHQVDLTQTCHPFKKMIEKI